MVHHKDRDKENNSPNNLHVCKNQKQFDYFHKKETKRHGAKASYKGFDKKKKLGLIGLTNFKIQ